MTHPVLDVYSFWWLAGQWQVGRVLPPTVSVSPSLPVSLALSLSLSLSLCAERHGQGRPRRAII